MLNNFLRAIPALERIDSVDNGARREDQAQRHNAEFLQMPRAIKLAQPAKHNDEVKTNGINQSYAVVITVAR